MKFHTHWFGCLLIAILTLLGSTGPASARLVRFPRHRPPPKPVYTAISSVDRSAMTITTAPKNSTGTTPRIYHFRSETKITLNGNPGTVADLKPGQRIRVGLGADADLAEELAVTTPPPGSGKGKTGKRHPH